MRSWVRAGEKKPSCAPFISAAAVLFFSLPQNNSNRVSLWEMRSGATSGVIPVPKCQRSDFTCSDSSGFTVGPERRTPHCASNSRLAAPRWKEKNCVLSVRLERRHCFIFLFSWILWKYFCSRAR